MDFDEARLKRAQARRERATLHKSSLAPVELDLDVLGAEDALSLVTKLTAECWSIGGLPLPAYTREETPYRFVPW